MDATAATILDTTEPETPGDTSVALPDPREAQTETTAAQHLDQAALERVRTYLAITDKAEAKAQEQSLQRAEDVVALYESMAWVAEMDATAPIPTRKGSGRRQDPRSFERFTRWVGEARSIPASARRLRQLKDAHRMLTEFSLNQVQPTPRSERVIRPLVPLAKAGHGERLPELWQQAVTASEGGLPTAADVQRVVGAFRKNIATDSPTEAQIATTVSRARKHLEWLWKADPRTCNDVIESFSQEHTTGALVAAQSPKD